MNGDFYYLILWFCTLREQVKVHSSPHHCLSERIIKLYSCFGDTLSELDVESCVLSCILVNITGSSFSATSNWDGVKHHRLACSSAGETRKKERGKGRNGNLSQIGIRSSLKSTWCCPVCLSLTTTAVVFYEEGTDEGVFIGEAQGLSQAWMSFKLFPTDLLCS